MAPHRSVATEPCAPCCFHGENARKMEMAGINPPASPHQSSSLSDAAEQKQIKAAQFQVPGQSSLFLEQRWPPAAP